MKHFPLYLHEMIMQRLHGSMRSHPRLTPGSQKYLHSLKIHNSGDNPRRDDELKASMWHTMREIVLFFMKKE